MVSFEVEASRYVKDPGCIVVQHNSLIIQGLALFAADSASTFRSSFYNRIGTQITDGEKVSCMHIYHPQTTMAIAD
jgi:hypothetical protein